MARTRTYSELQREMEMNMESSRCDEQLRLQPGDGVIQVK